MPKQQIACSVLIREIYLTWEQDTRPFLRGLPAQGMVDLAAEEQLLRGLTPGKRLLLRKLLEQMLENSVRYCLQKDDTEKLLKRTERENEKE